VREGGQVKLLPQDGEVYVLAKSDGRVDKERAIRHKKLRRLLTRLHELRKQLPDRDKLLMALGAAKKEAGRFYALLKITVPGADRAVNAETFSFKFDRARLRVVRRREGSYLLRSNLTGKTPGELWSYYVQLGQVEEAFKTWPCAPCITRSWNASKRTSSWRSSTTRCRCVCGSDCGR
jgi:hypothetical protein